MSDSRAQNDTRVANRPDAGSGPPPGGSRLPANAPARIGRFEIVALLGEGAFGRVYRGFDADLKRDVAIKVPHSSGLNDEFRERFLREARAIAAIHHPNVCPVYEVGQDGDLPFIIMRYVAGTTLASIVDNLKTPMPPRNAVMIARKLALGMAAAHAQNVTHRDLKPANVLYDTANREVLITDFGLARMSGEVHLTAKDSFLGTPAYTSPEQANRQMHEVGPLSDVYSLGVILYEMLTGNVPFDGSVMEVAIAHCITAPTPPSERRPGIDPKLDAIVLRAMQKKPADRYPGARALADALTDYLRPGEASGGSTGSVELPAMGSAATRGGAETVAEKRSGRRTAPAFEVVPDKPKSKPVVVVEEDEDDAGGEEAEEVRRSAARKSAKQSKGGKKKKKKEQSPVAKYAIPGVGLLLAVVALVLLIVFVTRDKPKETVQKKDETPAPAPAPVRPAPSTQPAVQPVVNPPKAEPKSDPAFDALRNKLLEEWRLTTGLATQGQFAQWGAEDKFFFVKFEADGRATIGLDSLDPTVRLQLVKDNERRVVRYRVVAADAITFTDVPPTLPAGVGRGPFAANTTVTVQIVGDTLVLRYGANTASFKRVLRSP
jgi:serine/threonine protein kinase